MDIFSRAISATPILRDLPLAAQVPIITLAVLLLSVIINVASQLLLPKSSSAPPVVFHYFPYIGSAVTYGMDPYTFFFECRKRYGDIFTFVLFGKKMTVALGPKGSSLVLNGKLNDVCAEDVYGAVCTPVFGPDAIYDVPNSVLMEQKKFVKAGLTTANFKVYVGQIVDEINQFLDGDIQFAPFKKTDSASVDIFKAMCEITILTASRTLQGPEIRASMDKTFADLYHDLDGGFTPINFILPGLPSPANLRRDRAQKQMAKFYEEIIAKRRASGSSEAENSSGHHDMIATLMEQKYKDGRPLTDRAISSMMIALLMAGQHTSSATVTWALLRLGSKPHIIQELYDEQVRVYGNPDGSLRPLDYETNKTSLPFMDAVIRETLRMHPPIHSIMRRVLQDIPVPPTLSAGHRRTDLRNDEGKTLVIPKGHNVLAAPGVSAIDPELWMDADDFVPSRWLENGVLKNEDRSGGAKGVESNGDAAPETVDFGWGVISTGTNSPYLPFGGGRHRCIGEQFAYLQLGTIISTIVRTFDWKINAGDGKVGKCPEPDYTSMIVLPKACDFVMTKRKAVK